MSAGARGGEGDRGPPPVRFAPPRPGLMHWAGGAFGILRSISQTIRLGLSSTHLGPPNTARFHCVCNRGCSTAEILHTRRHAHWRATDRQTHPLHHCAGSALPTGPGPGRTTWMMDPARGCLAESAIAPRPVLVGP
eukprot:scaffold13622_cov107-Isochrysis_galbana.AAC.1